MIKARHSQEIEDFIFFIEQTLSLLAEEKYDDFLAMYDSSRISGEGLLLALRYLDEDRPIVKVDDPMKAECSRPNIYTGQFKDGSGYWIDYDLATIFKPLPEQVQIRRLNLCIILRLADQSIPLVNDKLADFAAPP